MSLKICLKISKKFSIFIDFFKSQKLNYGSFDLFLDGRFSIIKHPPLVWVAFLQIRPGRIRFLVIMVGRVVPRYLPTQQFAIRENYPVRFFLPPPIASQKTVAAIFTIFRTEKTFSEILSTIVKTRSGEPEQKIYSFPKFIF